MTTTKPRAVRIRAGLYRLEGVTHTDHQRFYGRCHGQIFAEWFPGEMDDGERIPPSWECYCEKCNDCDPNGWPRLKDCLREAPAFWMEANP